MPVAWVAMAEEDNDPAIFLNAVSMALRKASVRLSDVASLVLGSQGAPTAETAMRTLINAVEAAEQPCALVLDDYHVVENETVHRAISYLVDHMPESMRLVIASRTEPPLAMARWRLQGKMTEVTQADLQFSLGEGAQLLNTIHRLGIPGEQLERLVATTEGWAAGLQFVALALRNRTSVADVLTMVQQSRHMVDFLAEEVFTQQREALQRFLLMTSVLERFSASLCDAVTQRTDSADLLAEALRRSLFLLPLEGDTPQYRYHRLFAQFLQGRLQRTAPETVPELHRRAAAWHESSGHLSEALQHLLAAADYGGAARVMERLGRSMLERGEARTVQTWLAKLPDAEIASRPGLCLIRAWSYLQTGQAEAGERWIERADQALLHRRAGGASEEADARKLKGEIAALRCRLPIFRHEAGPALRWARTALACLPEEGSPLRLGVQMDLGMHYYFRQGDLVKASRVFSDCARLSVANGNAETGLFALTYLGWVRVSQGRLHQAGDVYQYALQVARDLKWDLSPISGFVHVSMATLLLEWYELDEARRYLAEAMRRAEQGGVMQVLILGYREEVRQYLISGEYHRIGDPLNRLRSLGAGSAADFWEAVAAYLQGDVERAQAWAVATGFEPDAEPNFGNVLRYAFYGDVLMLLGRPDLALRVAARMRAFAESAGGVTVAMRADLLAAIAHDALGDTRASVAALGGALGRAAREGGVWGFLSRGNRLAPVLSHYLAAAQQGGSRPGQEISVAHARRLLSILAPGQPLEPAVDRSDATLLSEREQEVLRAISAGDSNEEIARRLFVTVGTVKTHLHRIYGKLDVRSRTQAVARARSQGLLG